LFAAYDEALSFIKNLQPSVQEMGAKAQKKDQSILSSVQKNMKHLEDGSLKRTVEKKLEKLAAWEETAESRLEQLELRRDFFVACGTIVTNAQAEIEEVSSNWQLFKDGSIAAHASGAKALQSLTEFQTAAEKYVKVRTN
jgi:activator of 2-hydroxyglutaryl-CoA dehydratase